MVESFTHLNNNQGPTLIIFPHAGAVIAQYIKWCRSSLAGHFNIYIFNNKRVTTHWDELIQQLSHDIYQLNENNIAFFGHSMGALIAHHVGIKSPNLTIKLFLSAMNPPFQEQLERFKNIASMEATSFLDLLIKWQAIPQELFADQDHLQQLVSFIKSDFSLMATCSEHINAIPSSHTVHCLAPIRDKISQFSTMMKWQSLYTGPFTIKAMPGGHFYLFDGDKTLESYLIKSV